MVNAKTPPHNREDPPPPDLEQPHVPIFNRLIKVQLVLCQMEGRNYQVISRNYEGYCEKFEEL